MSQETTTPQKNTAARFVAGMHEGETVWVEAPAPHGTCGAVKRLKTPGISAASRCSPKTKTAMPTGEFIHGTCDYDRVDATDEALAAIIAEAS